ncbi:putative integral membrane sensor protein [Gloeocapsa sp. PCC 7428]|uniref:MHYT domain-containing protein n=1 Tax=Gloeocapsa sp. PCC 7428 TaxID=1173026 RepID=UPI0002A610C4|nr:MHYT domain-containing protein [Gloeocapsa sp. PCC 7428]AFZ29139.1 putative integral membrane sensor protein [Gloeocapsa sp. PCC 7428]
MTVIYNPYLVIVSAFIAVLASYTALDLAGRVATSQGADRKVWLVGGAIAMGTGIWSMHFIGMLAFSLHSSAQQIPVGYNLPITIISLLAAIFAAGLSLSLVSRPRVGLPTLLTSAILMGVGIGAMHYLGMAAMQMTAVIRYDPILFLLSVALAVVVSLVALKLSIKFRRQTQNVSKKPQLIISALIMGAGILSLHYTGMAAARFTEDYERYVESATINNSSLAFYVACFTFLILGATLAITSDKAGREYGMRDY